MTDSTFTRHSSTVIRMSDEYRLGRDWIGIVVPGGIYDVEYDLKQVQEDGFARYHIGEVMDKNECWETDTLDLGSSIAWKVFCDADRKLYQRCGLHTQGAVVPDHLLGTFNLYNSDLDLYRRR